MTRFAKPIGLALCLAASAAFAHQGVTNPAVMARMQAMTEIAGLAKSLHQMASGKSRFDSQQVRQTADELASRARDIPALFRVAASDPKSEARSEVWLDYEGFSARAENLEAAALAAAGAEDPEALQAAVSGIVTSCKACHQGYRD